MGYLVNPVILTKTGGNGTEPGSESEDPGPVNMDGPGVGGRSDLRREHRPTYNRILICTCDYIELDYTNIISLVYCNLDHAN